MSVDVHDLELIDKVHLVRSMVTPLDLVDMLDIECVRGKIRSPHHPDERTPSCHLYEDGYYCYATGRHGDVIDLFMALTGSTFGAAVNKLLSGAERIEADVDRVRRHVPSVPDLTDEWQLEPALDAAASDLWTALLPGVARATVDELAASDLLRGSLAEVLIAHRHGPTVHGIKVRRPDGSKSSVPGSSYAIGLYRPRPRTGSTRCVITEGESDCWSLMDIDSDVDLCALPGGAGLWRPQWLDDLAGYSVIATAFDNDRAGRAATEKVRSAVGWDRWTELEVPQLYPDVRSARSSGWMPHL